MNHGIADFRSSIYDCKKEVVISVPIDIDYLTGHPEFIPAIAAWHHDEWAYLRPGDTIEARTKRLCAELGYRQIPTTVVAFCGQQVFGSAQLIKHDMDTHMELTPWLAGVYTAAEYRHQGIASALIGRIIEEARTLGVGKFYLYTPSAEAFYVKLGWKTIEKTRYKNTDVTVMSYEVQ
jgi:N-acetylglutamate synthase-like GNAT family acetyltransferase